jgi:hypothetical protein
VLPDDLSRGRGGATTSDFVFARFDEFNARPHTCDAACDLDGINQQPGTELFFAAGRRSFLTVGATEARGERIWCFPPFPAVGEFVKTIEAAWRADERTSATCVVPEWPTAPWFRRILRRRNPIWRILERIPAGAEGAAAVLAGEAQRRRLFPGRPARSAAERDYALLVIAFP